MINLNISSVKKIIFVLFALSIIGSQSCEQGPLKTLKITYKTKHHVSTPVMNRAISGERVDFIDMGKNQMKVEDQKEIYGANRMEGKKGDGSNY